MESLLAIANASAGSTDDASVELALAILRKGYEVGVAITSTPDELDEALAGHPDVDGVVVLGGDGSLHAVVAALRKVTRLPLDVHLMIEAPERYLADFVRAGASILTIHVEACAHLHRAVQQIRELGALPGVTLNPATSLDSVSEILPYVDQVLIMSVNPGFGGQAFIPEAAEKVRNIRAMVGPNVIIEVDGGVTPETAGLVAKAGANVLVAGSAVFKGGTPERYAANMAAIRKAAEAAR